MGAKAGPSAGQTIDIEVRLLRAMFEGVWTLDLRTRTLDWAPGLDMFGYAPDELGDHGAWWEEHVHPEDLRRAQDTSRRAIAGGAAGWSVEYRFRRRDGSWADVSAHAVIDRDESGHAVRASGTMMDLTRRKRTERVPDGAFEITEGKSAEDEARTTHRLLRLVLDTLPVGVAVTDRHGNIVISNPSTRRIWGDVIAPATDRYERSIGFWHGSGKRIEQEEWGSQRALRGGETSLNELIDIETIDGRTSTMRNSAAPIRDEEGEIVGAVVVNEDVTEMVVASDELGRRERRQAGLAQLGLSALRGENEQALFDEAVSLVARTLVVEYAAVFELRPEEKRMEFRAGAGPWELETVARLRVPWAPGFMAWFYMQSQAPVVVEDLRHETRFVPCELLIAHGVQSGIAVPIAGSPRAFGAIEANSRSKRQFTDDEVSFMWSVANVLAISLAREQSAMELREKREQLQALSRRLIEAQEAERRAVARELHDDFGQVLTALRLNLQKVPDERENIALVDGAIARMRDLVQDLRPPQLDELGLEEALRWYARREGSRAGLVVTDDVETLGAAPAPAVATTCFRVMQEALTNVIRHAQSPSVTISLRSLDAHFELVVRDDGIGFAVAEARKRAARGESHGLLGMKERVELAGGELEIDSAVGRGTTIRARLPRAGPGRRGGS